MLLTAGGLSRRLTLALQAEARATKPRRLKLANVAYALVRAASRLVSMLVPEASDDTSVDAARLGACATKA